MLMKMPGPEVRATLTLPLFPPRSSGSNFAKTVLLPVTLLNTRAVNSENQLLAGGESPFFTLSFLVTNAKRKKQDYLRDSVSHLIVHLYRL